MATVPATQEQSQKDQEFEINTGKGSQSDPVKKTKL
jgi:hypothetical protein